MRNSFWKFQAGCTVLALSFGLLSARAHAQTASFTDLSPDHPVYAAGEYLKSKGIISGYSDGSFKPDKGVIRAEAIKIIVAPLLDSASLAQITTSPFSDVKQGDWFLGYVEAARQNGIVDGPPEKTAFNGGNPVLKAEFFKMLQQAHSAKPLETLSEIQLPLAPDVGSPSDWFYPYMRYAIASSMTMIGADGLLRPDRPLTRGDCALILHRFLMYKEGRRTQALLSEAESEIIIILGALDKNDIVTAEHASARGLLAARGAHLIKPDEPIVQGALKTAEAFRALVRAYRAGLNKDYEQVTKLAGDAWNLSTRAKELAPNLAGISDQVQKIAKGMADSARTLMQTPQ
ncbi:S-layer homology domain-containing protein [Candidatus Peribacteria bacterium]|nr:S-layer homology domain-containing protein [Candidatus Peribacteria bacterium]